MDLWRVAAFAVVIVLVTAAYLVARQTGRRTPGMLPTWATIAVVGLLSVAGVLTVAAIRG